MVKKYKIFTDGGSRGNPGISGAGFVVVDYDGKKIHEESIYLGKKTNNEAEYLGFLRSLAWISECKIKEIDSVSWHLDSKLVVEQINKNWKIKKEELKILAEKCFKIIDALPYPIKISHIPREKNALADALANQAMDSQASFN